MAVADTVKLLAVLGLKDEFSGPARKITKSLDGMDAKLKNTDTIGTKIGKNIGTGIKTSAVLAAGAIGFLATNVGLGLKSLSELETITTQTNAVLKSTKGVAGETAESIRDLAEKYEGLNATIDDKVIQSAENVLLTFTSIRKQAFEPAIAAALDMSTALGTDLQGSVIQIGKALQDPIKGITALRRVGVNFSADQVTVIKKLVETGKTLDAQKLILKELNTEFGGSFLAGGNTTQGKIAKFKDSIEDLQQALARALLPTIGKVADKLSAFLADPKVVKTIGELGQKIAGLFSDENIAAGGRFLQDAFKTAKEAAPIVESAARATFGLVQGAVGLFKSLPGPIQGLAVGAFAVNKLTGGLVTNIAGGLKDLIKQRGNTPATPLFVSDVSGGGGPGGVPVGGKKTGISKAIDIVSKVFMVGIAIETINELANALGDQSKENAQATATQLQQVNQFGAKAASADLQKALDLINAKLAPTNDITPEGIAIAFNIDGIRDTLHEERDALVAALTKKNFEDAAIATGRRLSGLPDTTQTDTLAGKLKDDIVNLSRLNRAAILDTLERLPGILKKANSAKDIAKSVKDAVHLLVEKQQGNLGETQKVLGELRDKLKNTHDPKTAAILRAAIHQVESKLPPRQLAITAVAKADGILKSNRSTGDKIKALQGIERDLKDHKLPGATRKVEEKIAALRRSQVEAQHATTQAIKDKDMSPTINVPVVANSYITTNGITSAFHFAANLGSGRRIQG